MRTIKLVIIGDSGVGKTSIRGKYIDGRFSTGYRATIGTDFITKKVPHHSKSDETVTLQIWDTAGQERFSGLSAAFFRGADAAMLVFDVNRPQTLAGLRKWWDEFKTRAPVAEEEAEDYCCIVVGNKTDLVDESRSSNDEPISVVTETEALNFLEELVPRSKSDEQAELDEEHPRIDVEDFDRVEGSSRDDTNADSSTSTRTQSISILRPSSSASLKGLHQKRTKKSESHSSERLPLRGTMTTSRSSISIYHTPASSLFDSSYDSASSTPLIQSPPPPPPDVDVSPSTSPSKKRESQRFRSASSSSSGTTITPSLFTKKQLQGDSTSAPVLDTNNNNMAQMLSPKPEKRPRLFFTSAKTGQGLTDAFEYVARRVVTRWEREEEVESRMMHIRETTDDTFRLDGSNDLRSRAKKWTSALKCCGT